MKIASYPLLVVIAIVLFFSCHTQQPQTMQPPARVKIDVDSFLNTGIQGGLTEIQASGLAITNSNNQRVIRLAKMMLDDHTQTDSLLMQQQTDRKIVTKDSIDATHQQSVSELGKLSGAAFDKAYINMMVTNHQASLQLFTTAANSTDDAISKLAAATLPEIQMHLDSAQAVLTSLK